MKLAAITPCPICGMPLTVRPLVQGKEAGITISQSDCDCELAQFLEQFPEALSVFRYNCVKALVSLKLSNDLNKTFLFGYHYSAPFSLKDWKGYYGGGPT